MSVSSRKTLRLVLVWLAERLTGAHTVPARSERQPASSTSLALLQTKQTSMYHVSRAFSSAFRVEGGVFRLPRRAELTKGDV